MSRVFISYAHSTQEHKQAVAQLAETLRRAKLTVIIDSDVTEPQGWPRWMKRQLEEARWVLMVFDDTYRRRFDGEEAPGLCLVTTRESIADLAPYRDSAAPELRLQRLAEGAGVELLRSLGVKGSNGEYRQLVKDVNGHALTFNLLVNYLAQAHNGDIRRRDRVELDKADKEIQGGPAGRRQRALLRFLGL